MSAYRHWLLEVLGGVPHQHPSFLLELISFGPKEWSLANGWEMPSCSYLEPQGLLFDDSRFECLEVSE
jgi:hypothetical protein